MSRILLITHSWPPLLTANSIQISHWVEELAGRGYEFEILTVNPIHSCDTEGMPPLEHRNLRVRPAFSLESAFSRLKLTGLLRRLIPSLMAIPDQQRLWVPFAVRLAENSVDFESIDAILSCSHYLSNHLVALRLVEAAQKKGLSIPWIAHFSDPWTDSIYFQPLSRWQKGWNLAKEREIIFRANFLTFPCPELRDRVISKYGTDSGDLFNKSMVIPHSFKGNLYELQKNQKGASARPGSLVRFIHTGSFYRQRTPIPFFKVIRKLMQGGFYRGYECLFVGMEPHYDKVIYSYGIREIVRTVPKVSYLESLSYMLTADVLVLIDAPCDGRDSVFFPSKLADYLGSGIPIMGITPESSASARILREYGQCALDINDMESIAGYMKELLSGEIVPGRYEPPSSLSVEAVARQWAGLLDGIRKNV